MRYRESVNRTSSPDPGDPSLCIQRGFIRATSFTDVVFKMVVGAKRKGFPLVTEGWDVSKAEVMHTDHARLKVVYTLHKIQRKRWVR
jgi:hypothetical protein